MELNKIYQGDAYETLLTFESESIDCVVTSPPYWNLRDYGVEGQIGLEFTITEYIQKLRLVFNEVYRVLKKSGTCFINLGDTYNGSLKGEGCSNTDKLNIPIEAMPIENKKRIITNIPKKSLCHIPHRFAISMIDNGWCLRNTIIWHKSNIMPESVRDRFTEDYEYVFFFVKNRQYYFEQQFEPSIDPESYNGKRRRNPSSAYKTGDKFLSQNFWNLKGKKYPNRNKRCVWSIPTYPFKGSHFATFPENLIIPMIKSGCPKNGIVLDPFSGVATTCMVAKKLNRNYVGIELNPKYIEMSEKRIDQECGTLL